MKLLCHNLRKKSNKLRLDDTKRVPFKQFYSVLVATTYRLENALVRTNENLQIGILAARKKGEDE